MNSAILLGQFQSFDSSGCSIHRVFIESKMAEIPRGPTTKEKLATIVSGFDEFDTEMKRGTRVRSFNAQPYFPYG